MTQMGSPISAVVTDANGATINLGNASGAFSGAPVSIVLTDANGKTLNVGPGVVAKYDATAQQADISSTTLYTVPANGAGTYRVTVYQEITQVATTSSTMPNLVFNFTTATGISAQARGLTGNDTDNLLAG